MGMENLSGPAAAAIKYDEDDDDVVDNDADPKILCY